MRTTSSLLVLALIGCGDNLAPPEGGGAGSSVTPAGFADTNPGSDYGPPPVSEHVAPPILTWLGSTSKSIFIEVCAGETGLPSGFIMQWLPSANFSGWQRTAATCGASFTCDSYALAANECVTVEVGRLFDTDGVTFTCDELACGTDYLFRAQGLETATLVRSRWSDTLEAKTLACEALHNCTLTQGYWKNHDAWPISAVRLGRTTYTQNEMLAIFDTPARGNGLVSLSHQLAAARLNIAYGADPTDANASIGAADTLIDGLVVPPIGDGYLAPAATGYLVDALAAFNEGETGPGHCVE